MSLRVLEREIRRLKKDNAALRAELAAIKARQAQPIAPPQETAA